MVVVVVVVVVVETDRVASAQVSQKTQGNGPYDNSNKNDCKVDHGGGPCAPRWGLID